MASFATCASLLVYILVALISGFISFAHSKRYNGELFIWNPSKEIIKKYYIVHNEVYDIYSECLEKLMIASDDILLNIKAFYIEFRGGKIFKNTSKFIKKEEIFYYKRLSPKECIIFSTFLPEGMPSFALEWETPTFMKVSLILQYNGRDGNIYESIVYKHTIKSFFYYLFKR